MTLKQIKAQAAHKGPPLPNIPFTIKTGPEMPPEPFTVRQFAGEWVVVDANGMAIAGPMSLDASLLLAAAPRMLEALKYTQELICLARKYFPKSIRNSDRFRLESTNAAIGTALHAAKGA